ncbi:MAG: acyl-CoA dehydrogenase family protein [Saprospiraceae bacterium]|nr:acyl-CoA dehydrogenase family protein [Saprospiraceae bacterium]
MANESTTNVLRGGQYLIKESDPGDIFAPEMLNDEQRLIKSTVLDFISQNIRPRLAAIEEKEPGIAGMIMEEAAAVGLLGTHMPEEYGGMNLDTNTNTLISETLGPAGSITVSLAAHTGIGMLPILYFGTDKQKQDYLPRLISGELKASYCLTEPGSGSDALAAKTRADLSTDGKTYLLNGQKMWISNAGFANFFIVFAKISGEQFTAFIVEKGVAGLTLGEEEHKLGIHGSSTRQVFFENTPVPIENVLGDIGKGHLIAFNVLNIGRFKLGAMVCGGSQSLIDHSIRYAKERHQFDKPIAEFGAIQHKLAEQAIRTFAMQSALYRTSDLLQDWKSAQMAEGRTFAEATLLSAEEYAIECSILKVAGSEILDFVVDETLQIHGGIGYSEEYPIARAYRDARINRIFEGTNEINRMLMVDMLLRRAMKGQVDIVGPAWAVQKELAAMPGFETLTGEYAQEIKAIADFKKIVLMVAGGAAKLQMDGQLNIKDEQEILMNIADMMIDTFLAESLCLRTRLLQGRDKPQSQDIYDAMLRVFLHDATQRMQRNATDAIVSFAGGDLQKTFLMGVKRFLKYPPVNVRDERRKIAAALIGANGWCF